MPNSPDSRTTVVRRAAETDLDALIALNHGLFSEDSALRDQFSIVEWPGRRKYFEDLLSDGRTQVVWAAEKGGEVIGYLVGRLKAPMDIRPVSSADLESLFVEQRHRDAGVGGALVRAFLAWASAHDAGRITVNAYVENQDAIRFYERFGLRRKAVTLDMPLRQRDRRESPGSRTDDSRRRLRSTPQSSPSEPEEP